MLPMICLGIGIEEEKEAQYYEDDTDIYSEHVLPNNQYSDDRIALNLPERFAVIIYNQ